MKAIKAVTAVDPLTVRITTNGPTPLLLNNLSRIAILPAEYAKTTTGEMNGGKGVIGTGPFKFVSWTPDSVIVLARNDDYWGGPAAWEKVTFRIFKNNSARVLRCHARQTLEKLVCIVEVKITPVLPVRRSQFFANQNLPLPPSRVFRDSEEVLLMQRKHLLGGMGLNLKANSKPPSPS